MNVWEKRINLGHVFHNEDLTFEQIRDGVVSILDRSGWAIDNPVVGDLLDELGETEHADHFDEVWDAIYDEADRDRVWIETIR